MIYCMKRKNEYGMNRQCNQATKDGMLTKKVDCAQHYLNERE